MMVNRDCIVHTTIPILDINLGNYQWLSGT